MGPQGLETEDMERPVLLTYDIFGTVLDWRRGLREAVARFGVGLRDEDFERVVDAQGAAEQGRYRSYEAITAASLVQELGLPLTVGRAIGASVGTWPLYEDARQGLARLLRLAPCAATTNSDCAHGEQVQVGLGFRLSAWISAEDARCYKPAAEVWMYTSRRLGVPFGRHWWHVSAYADYDLERARSLGLTCVYVERPHARIGPADLIVRDLPDLARRIEALD